MIYFRLPVNKTHLGEPLFPETEEVIKYLFPTKSTKNNSSYEEDYILHFVISIPNVFPLLTYS